LDTTTAYTFLQGSTIVWCTVVWDAQQQD
jgi:hypothetical protein